MAAGLTPPPQGSMPPGGSPTAMPTQNQGQAPEAPTMPPEEAMAIMQKFGISQKDVPMLQAAIESLEAAGMLSEEPEAEEPPEASSDANARLAQMLAG